MAGKWYKLKSGTPYYSPRGVPPVPGAEEIDEPVDPPAPPPEPKGDQAAEAEAKAPAKGKGKK